MNNYFVRVIVLCGLLSAGTPSVANAQTPSAHTRKTQTDFEWLQQQLNKFGKRQGPEGAPNERQIAVPERRPERTYEDPIPRDIRARANALFPFVSQQDERTKYIIEEMRAAADRERGNSYSIRVGR
jgi:hypothetical protein